MTSYVALIRGIGPGDPRKSNASLVGVLDELGLASPRAVISSGNVVFESRAKDPDALGDRIEAAWPELRGFTATTIVKSRDQLQEALDVRAFGDDAHGKGSYQLVTFFKRPTTPGFDLPYAPDGQSSRIVAFHANALYTVTDNESSQTTQWMQWLERTYGKEITSRTPLTIERILRKMS